MTPILISPRFQIYDDFLTDEECADLRAASEPGLQPDSVVDRLTGASRTMRARTSWGTSFAKRANGVIQRIEDQVAEITNTHVSQGECVQILKYLPGQEYQPHYDWFDERDPGSAKHLEGGGQRIITALVYLNDCEQGGATELTAIQTKIYPRTGRLLIFRYPRCDRDTLHAGLPVELGEKWVATLWIRERTWTSVL